MTIDRGNARIFTVGSDTGTGEYTVVKADDPAYSSCTCSAFFYKTRNVVPGTCKHLDRLVAAPTGFVAGKATDLDDIEDLFARALHWVGGEAQHIERARLLVEAYLKGRDGR